MSIITVGAKVVRFAVVGRSELCPLSAQIHILLTRDRDTISLSAKEAPFPSYFQKREEG